MATKRQNQHSVVVLRDKAKKVAPLFLNDLEVAGSVRQRKQEIKYVRAHRRWEQLMFAYAGPTDKLVYILSGSWPDHLRLKRGEK